MAPSTKRIRKVELSVTSCELVATSDMNVDTVTARLGVGLGGGARFGFQLLAQSQGACVLSPPASADEEADEAHRYEDQDWKRDVEDVSHQSRPRLPGIGSWSWSAARAAVSLLW